MVNFPAIIASETVGVVSGVMVVFLLIVGLLFVAGLIGLFVFWIAMLVDALSRKDWQSDDQRLMWIVILVVSFFMQLYWLAALVYYFAAKRPLDRGESSTLFGSQPVPQKKLNAEKSTKSKSPKK